MTRMNYNLLSKLKVRIFVCLYVSFYSIFNFFFKRVTNSCVKHNNLKMLISRIRCTNDVNHTFFLKSKRFGKIKVIRKFVHRSIHIYISTKSFSNVDPSCVCKTETHMRVPRYPSKKVYLFNFYDICDKKKPDGRTKRPYPPRKKASDSGQLIAKINS